MNQVLQSGAQRLYQSRRKLATAGIIALACVLGYHAIFGANGFLVYHQKQTELQKLDQEIKTLQQENERSEQQVKALKTDPQAIEKEAREQLHYARDGEIIYKLPAATPTQTQKK
ncbi:MAG TPA: septum formation initiator family protein [Candidatus Angelobacter sp.]|nr:septum formation initiator family protein [Candidatus Angelobacter sp.]